MRLAWLWLAVTVFTFSSSARCALRNLFRDWLKPPPKISDSDLRESRRFLEARRCFLTALNLLNYVISLGEKRSAPELLRLLHLAEQEGLVSLPVLAAFDHSFKDSKRMMSAEFGSPGGFRVTGYVPPSPRSFKLSLGLVPKHDHLFIKAGFKFLAPVDAFGEQRQEFEVDLHVFASGRATVKVGDSPEEQYEFMPEHCSDLVTSALGKVSP